MAAKKKPKRTGAETLSWTTAKTQASRNSGGHPSRGLTPDYSWREYGNRVYPTFPLSKQEKIV